MATRAGGMGKRVPKNMLDTTTYPKKKKKTPGAKLMGLAPTGKGKGAARKSSALSPKRPKKVMY